MDAFRTVVDRIRGEKSRLAIKRPIAPIPPVIAKRLIPDSPHEPLFPKLQRYGRGRPGITQEEEDWWVIRDERGRVVGGAMVSEIGDDHPVSIDLAVDPRRQGEGWATALYKALEGAGIDVESGSAASLAHGSVTVEGYAFMRARRRRVDKDAEAKIAARASVCPGCGPDCVDPSPRRVVSSLRATESRPRFVRQRGRASDP